MVCCTKDTANVEDAKIGTCQANAPKSCEGTVAPVGTQVTLFV